MGLQVTVDQLDIFGGVVDVPHARTSDPSTSQRSGRATEAEEGSTSLLRTGSAKHVALATLGEHPRTALQVERQSGRRGIWKRVSDLKNAGLVEGVAVQRDPFTKRDGIVWDLTAKGRAVLATLNAGREVRL
ncbi:MAG TPA: hypothetical protein VH482_37960 [Thermomicrobiales bacterium]|jgi:hypothetical protein